MVGDIHWVLPLLVGLTQASDDPACLLDWDAGPCRGFQEVWAFNQETKICQIQTYGGCQGNGNRYSSQKDCQNACLLELPRQGPGVSDICSQPTVLSKKVCMGFFPRYTFSPTTRKCEQVVYGGCGGSSNLFVTLSECEAACSKSTGGLQPRLGLNVGITFPNPSKDVCSLPPVLPGMMSCMAMIPKWTFSQSEEVCVSYIYGGCRGTSNLFDSKDDCESSCPSKKRKTAEVCSLPIAPGPCRRLSLSPDFGFNTETSRCEAFNYGGCRGNGNRFRNVEECVNTCGGGEPLLSTNICKEAQCDQTEVIVQKAKGCLPVTTPGDCCPSHWDCSNWERRLANKTQCFFSSSKDPVGSFYEPGEDIPAVSEINGCNQACRCSSLLNGDAEILCAMVDCHMKEPKGFTRDSCRTKYDKMNQCCPSGFNCGNNLTSLASCSMDSKTFYEGEKMYPQADNCKVCHCTKEWDGDLSGEFCETVDCGLQLYGNKLVRGCQPIFRDDVCCPVDWVCPDEVSSSSQPGTVPALRSSDTCLLPMAPGPCKKLSPPQFYFDATTRRCQQFNYGGCKGNGNRFDTLDDCVSTCSQLMLERSQPNPLDPDTHQAMCEEENVEGKCRGHQIRFWHNSKTGACEQFVYTGCQGNKNNYASVEECEATCRVGPKNIAGKDPVCNTPVTVGTCKSRLEKFYYDQQSGLCKTFFFSGCQGGENMFDSHPQCVAVCVKQEQLARSVHPQDLFVSNPCSQKKVSGPCRKASPRWFYNDQSRQCETFLYGGCRGNDNNFETEEECSLTCSPSPPLIQVGPAQTLPHPVSRDKGDGVLVVGDEVGVRGRGGSRLPGGFGATLPTDTKEIKMVAGLGAKLFSGVSEISGPDCPTVRLLEVLNVRKQVVNGINYVFSMRLDARSGPSCSSKKSVICSGLHLHRPLGCQDQELSSCLEIIRKKDISCQDKAEPQDPCLENKMTGRCKANFPRFYFDSKTGSCLPFIYGGCQGNGNNFADLEKCQEVCTSHLGKTPALLVRTPKLLPTQTSNLCQQKMEPGPCFALMPRFYFNQGSGDCQEFIYGGCKGNQNNFPGLSECLARCGGPTNRAAPFPPLPPPLPRCKLGNETFALGDLVRLNGMADCQTCVCSAPPSLTCHQKVCPALAFLPPRGGVNCILEKDELGCCETGYKCDELVMPPAPPPASGGSRGRLGGFRGEGVGGEIKKVAAVATNQLLSTLVGVTGGECQDAQLLEILEVARQIVAGTNFKLKLRIRIKTGGDCRQLEEKVCENIVIFRPLPVHCQEPSGDCLSVTKEQDIICV